jgi:hypothetical protein
VKKVVLLLVIFLLVGCTNNKLFNLTDKYYNKGEFINISAKDIKEDESFVLYTYNNFCVLPVHCENIFKEVMEKNKIDVLSIPFDDFKNTNFHKEVKYAPSILIVRNGDIVAYLDANSDKDLEKYQNITKFEEWLKEYINLEKTTE